MDPLEIRAKVEAVIAKYSEWGKVSDVWLSSGVMTELDPRPPMARIMDKPYKIGDVYVSAFSELASNEFRVAFVTSFDVLVQGDDDESGSDN